MQELEHKIRVALKAIPNWDTNQTRINKLLADSITSTSYLVEHTDKVFVLRIDKPFIHGVIPNRANEIKVLHALEASNLSNKLVYSDLANGILLSEYIDARVWTDEDLKNEEQLIALAKRLAELHSMSQENLEVDVDYYDLVGGIERYKQKLNTSESNKWADLANELISQCQHAPLVLCHNDLHSRNILESDLLSDSLYFIDWEYAGLGNPVFDITAVLHQLSSEKLRKVFLDTYKDTYAKLNTGAYSFLNTDDVARFEKIHDLLWALWLAILLKSASQSAETDLHTKEQLHTLQQRINSYSLIKTPHFEN